MSVLLGYIRERLATAAPYLIPAKVLFDEIRERGCGGRYTIYAELQPNDVLRSAPGVGRHLAPILLDVLHTSKRIRSE